MASFFCTYVTFQPVFTFDGKNGVESFLPFTSLNNLLPFLNLWDCNSGTSFAEKLDLHLCNLFSWGIGAFRHKMIVLSTSIPYTVTISTYPGIRLRPGFFSLSIISISTSTSSVIILISIPTLTSISKSPLEVLSVV